MPDKVEEILKSIHVMFAKSSAYNDSPDQVIVSKQEMFELLEELNEAIYEVLDRYEATTRSRERARLDMDRQAAAIVADAKRDSDEVHAASLLYTDTMLDELCALIDRTSQSIRHEYIEMLSEMDKRKEMLLANKEEVQEQMTEFHESEHFVNLLKEQRLSREKKRNSLHLTPTEEEQEEETQQKASYVIKVNKPGENSGITISSKRNRKGKKAAAAASDNSSDETASVLDEDAENIPYGTAFQAEDFDLDAEYLQWKEEQEGNASSEQPAPEKKSIFGNLFKKK